MKADNKAILLNVPTSLCNQMDGVVEEIGMNRTNFIQQSISRNLQYMNRYEIPNIRKQQYNYDNFFSSNS